MNLGIAFSWDTPHPAIRRDPDKGNTIPEVYCETNRNNRACLLPRLLLEFPLRDSSLFGERISQLSLRQNKNVTGAIDCRSLPAEV